MVTTRNVVARSYLVNADLHKKVKSLVSAEIASPNLHAESVNQVELGIIPREASSSYAGECTFKLQTPATEVSLPFVTFKANSVKYNFLIDSGASVNILSVNTSKKCDVKLHSCDTRVYAYNPSDPLPVLRTFSEFS